MIEKQVAVSLPRGLQAQGATEFVKKASTFNSEVNIMKEDKMVTCKSIMGVMCLAVRKGDEVVLMADGNDEQEAVRSLEDFLSSKHLLKE